MRKMQQDLGRSARIPDRIGASMESCAEELNRVFDVRVEHDHVLMFYQHVDLMAHLPVQAEALRWMVVVTALYCTVEML